jgi:hypothetical protein
MTKLCPFCKEEIQEDAVKCKHCHSFLYKIESNEPPEKVDTKENNRYNTYILDKDLVRFAKFSLSILAVFITVGIVLYGIDLKQTAKELGLANDRLEEGNKKIATTLPKIDSLEIIVNTVRGEVDSALQKANLALEEINHSRDSAYLLVSIIKTLDPSQAANLVEIKKSNPATFNSKLDFQKLWKPGQVIYILFLNGNNTQKDKVKQIAREWTQYANLRFDFDGNTANAQVRISFEEQSNYSFIGTDCIAIPQSQLTMALLVSASTTVSFEDRKGVLREFGHAIGLLNEQQNPNAHIKWNKTKVYTDFAKNYGWAKSNVDNNFFIQWTAKSKPFDQHSIMMAEIPAKYTLDGFQTSETDQLSESDKLFVARLYPR